MAETNTARSENDFDLFRPLRSRGGLENPFAIYALLRTVRPVMQMPVANYTGPGVWFLTRYADVEMALRDPRFSVERMRAPIIRENLERLPTFIQQSAQGLRSMLIMDPPDHTRVRKLANKAFTPRRVAAMRTQIEATVAELLAPLAPGASFDVIETLAAPLPAIVIAELLGVPPEDHRQFKAWAAEIVAGIGAEDADVRQSSTAAMLTLLEYLAGIIAARRQEPREDLISALVLAQEENDALTDNELLATCNLLLLAGHETTTNLIGNGLLALLREPKELARLRGDMTLLPSAIEEMLRYDGPVQATLRVVCEDIELDGHSIEAGSLVLVGIGGAVRCRTQSQSPHRFRVRCALLPRCAPCPTGGGDRRSRPARALPEPRSRGRSAAVPPQPRLARFEVAAGRHLIRAALAADAPPRRGEAACT
jgi:cytochrome P450